jgi:hypothetical protein
MQSRMPIIGQPHPNLQLLFRTRTAAIDGAGDKALIRTARLYFAFSRLCSLHSLDFVTV